VRAITGDDETVPTVMVGTRALVNRSVRRVIAAVDAGQPGILLAGGTLRARRLAGAAGLVVLTIMELADRPHSSGATGRGGASR